MTNSDGGETAHTTNLFNVQESMDWFRLTMCMFGLIVFTMIFEHGLHVAEKSTKSSAITKLLSRIYKELMILGFVSFVLLMIEQFKSLDEETLLMLEFSHVWIFFVALIFVLHACIALLLLRRVKRGWDANSHVPSPKLLIEYRANPPRRRPLLFMILCGRGRLRRQMEFHITQSFFIRTYDLPVEFDFAKYLRKSITFHITEHLEVKPTTWFTVLAILFLNFGLVASADGIHTVDPQYLIVAGYSLLALSLLLLCAVRITKDRLIGAAGCPDAASLPGALSRADFHDPGMVRPVPRAQRLMLVAHVAQHAKRLQESLGHVYPQRSPGIYSHALEIIMMLQCFILGLIVLLFGRGVTLVTSTSAVVDFVVSVFPHVCIMVWVSPRMLQDFIYVHSITHVTKDLVDAVLVHMDETYNLKVEVALLLRANVFQGNRMHRESSETQHTKILQFFLQLSAGTPTMSALNLISWLDRKALHLRRNQVHRLMRNIDSQQQAALTFEDFLSLVEFGDYILLQSLAPPESRPPETRAPLLVEDVVFFQDALALNETLTSETAATHTVNVPTVTPSHPSDRQVGLDAHSAGASARSRGATSGSDSGLELTPAATPSRPLLTEENVDLPPRPASLIKRMSTDVRLRSLSLASSVHASPSAGGGSFEAATSVPPPAADSLSLPPPTIAPSTSIQLPSSPGLERLSSSSLPHHPSPLLRDRALSHISHPELPTVATTLPTVDEAALLESAPPPLPLARARSISYHIAAVEARSRMAGAISDSAMTALAQLQQETIDAIIQAEQHPAEAVAQAAASEAPDLPSIAATAEVAHAVSAMPDPYESHRPPALRAIQSVVDVSPLRRIAVHNALLATQASHDSLPVPSAEHAPSHQQDADAAPPVEHHAVDILPITGPRALLARMRSASSTHVPLQEESSENDDSDTAAAAEPAHDAPHAPTHLRPRLRTSSSHMGHFPLAETPAPLPPSDAPPDVAPVPAPSPDEQ